MTLKPIQTCGSYDGDYYTLCLAFSDQHAMTLDGLSKEDLEEIKSCIECLLIED